MSANLKSDGFTGKEKYFRPSVAVDGVVLCLSNALVHPFDLEESKAKKYKMMKNLDSDLQFLDNTTGELKVLLIKRKAIKRDGTKRAFYGYWALPGGFIRSAENAEKALKIGLVTRVVSEEDLIPEVIKMSKKLSQFAPFVPRTIKAIVNFGMEGSLTSALMFEKYAQGALVQTEDKKEGINAFLEKRLPEFKGK